MAFILSGYFVTPIIPYFSPDPLVSGYIGFYAGIIGFGIIPMVVLIWLFFKLLMGYRVGAKTRRATLAAWMVCVVIFGSTILFSAKNFVDEESMADIIYNDTISRGVPMIIDLESSNHLLTNNNKLRLAMDDFFILSGDFYLNTVDFSIRPSDDVKMKIKKSGHAYGKNRKSAKNNLHSIKHNIDITNEGIGIRDFVKLSHGDRFRFQSYHYDIRMPIGTQIIFKGDSNMIPRRSLKDRKKVSTSTIYEMTDEGLVPKEILGENL